MIKLPKPLDSAPPDIVAAATEAGLLDVAYATLETPVGKLLLAATPRGLVRLAYVDAGEHEDEVLEQLSLRVSPRILAAPRRLDEPRRELDQYFAGARSEFEVPLDWQMVRGFGRRVLEATARIPFGSVSSYKRVASRSSSPVTASCIRPAGSAATPADSSANGCCWRSSVASGRSSE
jgi:methylated-DNA-[protein]-cysteine S-methyltransferase